MPAMQQALKYAGFRIKAHHGPSDVLVTGKGSEAQPLAGSQSLPGTAAPSVLHAGEPLTQAVISASAHAAGGTVLWAPPPTVCTALPRSSGPDACQDSEFPMFQRDNPGSSALQCLTPWWRLDSAVSKHNSLSAVKCMTVHLEMRSL